jgi:hypothetical protein
MMNGFHVVILPRERSEIAQCAQLSRRRISPLGFRAAANARMFVFDQRGREIALRVFI